MTKDQLLNLKAAADAQLKVLKNLPGEGDLSLIILKGHLLIEELLFALVSSAAKDASAIKSAGLSYYQLVWIAKALFEDDRLSPFWDAMLKLNTLRNTLAHQLEPRDLSEKLRLFSLAGSGGKAEAVDLVLSNPVAVMVSSIETICGMLTGLILNQSSST